MADVYQIITDRIIAQLENGSVPWHKPWKAGMHGWPKNLISKREYRGINVFMLSCTSYELPYWLTFKQAKQAGGSVRRGEKSTIVVFWKWLDRDVEDPNSGKTQQKRIPLLRYYNVFNAAQCDGVEAKIPNLDDEPSEPFEPIGACERIVSGMPQAPTIHHGTTGAFYRQSDDTVSMPSRERFESPEEYYSTLFHELTHSTGHQSRLKRPAIVEPSRFGSGSYSREELIAEMGAAFLSASAAIDNATLDNSAAYIDGWLRKLKADKHLVVQAAAGAQKAADFILGRKFDDQTDE
jgi:antirestriction protein ArdC